jgi:hypothetical protein
MALVVGYRMGLSPCDLGSYKSCQARQRRQDRYLMKDHQRLVLHHEENNGLHDGRQGKTVPIAVAANVDIIIMIRAQ